MTQNKVGSEEAGHGHIVATISVLQERMMSFLLQ